MGRGERYDSSKLTSITILDRNEFSETITNPERLKQYEYVDFTSVQPYQRVLRIHQRNELGDIHAYLTTYHENGQPKQYLEIVNSRAFGAYREWHENGVIKLEAQLIGGEANVTPGSENSWIFDGPAKGWDELGNLITLIHYEKGKLQGESLYYHSNGNLWKRVVFIDGAINGTFEVFKENGELLQCTQYVNGLKHGPSTRYWAGGAIASLEEYSYDNLENSSSYSQSGERIAEVKEGNGYRAVFGRNCVAELQQYVDGKQEGEVRIFTEQGYLIKLYHIKDGEKNGEEVEYFPTRSRPKISVNWSDGKLQGEIKTWYPNGQQESQREMSNNQKDGLLMAWYREGEVMLIEEYEAGKLMKGDYFKKGEKYPVSTVRNGKGEVTLYDSNGNLMRKITYRNSQPILD